jgi:hypothetical protein
MLFAAVPNSIKYFPAVITFFTTGYRLDDREVRVPVGTCSRANPASYPMGTGGSSFPWDKTTGAWSSHLTSSSCRGHVDILYEQIICIKSPPPFLLLLQKCLTSRLVSDNIHLPTKCQLLRRAVSVHSRNSWSTFPLHRWHIANTFPHETWFRNDAALYMSVPSFGDCSGSHETLAASLAPSNDCPHVWTVKHLKPHNLCLSKRSQLPIKSADCTLMMTGAAVRDNGGHVMPYLLTWTPPSTSFPRLSCALLCCETVGESGSLCLHVLTVPYINLPTFSPRQVSGIVRSSGFWNIRNCMQSVASQRTFRSRVSPPSPGSK